MDAEFKKLYDEWKYNTSFLSIIDNNNIFYQNLEKWCLEHKYEAINCIKEILLQEPDWCVTILEKLIPGTDIPTKHIGVGLTAYCNVWLNAICGTYYTGKLVDYYKDYKEYHKYMNTNYKAWDPRKEEDPNISLPDFKKGARNNPIENKKIVIDLDDTISKTYDGKYELSKPIMPIIEKLRELKSKGYDIIIYSSRNMRTYNRNVGEINVHTLPIILDFLKKYDVPHDEVIVGKPWCGFGGFYVDDKAIRPSEFAKLSEQEIQDILDKEKEFVKANVQ